MCRGHPRKIAGISVRLLLYFCPCPPRQSVLDRPWIWLVKIDQHQVEDQLVVQLPLVEQQYCQSVVDWYNKADGLKGN